MKSVKPDQVRGSRLRVKYLWYVEDSTCMLHTASVALEAVSNNATEHASIEEHASIG